jgi:hypothetical protein
LWLVACVGAKREPWQGQSQLCSRQAGPASLDGKRRGRLSLVTTVRAPLPRLALLKPGAAATRGSMTSRGAEVLTTEREGSFRTGSGLR